MANLTEVRWGGGCALAKSEGRCPTRRTGARVKKGFSQQLNLQEDHRGTYEAQRMVGSLPKKRLVEGGTNLVKKNGSKSTTLGKNSTWMVQREGLSGLTKNPSGPIQEKGKRRGGTKVKEVRIC